MLAAWIGLTAAIGVAESIDQTTEVEATALVSTSTQFAAAAEQSTAAVAVEPRPAQVQSTSESSVSADRATPANPTTVQAADVGISTVLEPVGKTETGALAVPDFGMAGWYRHGAQPGEPGPAVIAGHVDSFRGPDVFYSLRDLQPGNEIVVGRDDGSEVRFVVESVETTDKDELPVDRVFADTPEPTLRLITCGGSFDRSARSYESNVIVYARMVSPPG